jgi:hypothetical protein
MNYETVTYKRFISTSWEWHWLVIVQSACEVWGMIDISVWKTEPGKDDKRVYQLYMYGNKTHNIPQFKRFPVTVSQAILQGILCCAVMPHNCDLFHFSVRPLDLQIVTTGGPSYDKR